MNEITPEIGMGVTRQVGSDCLPFTVIEVVNHRTIRVQADQYRLVEGSTMSESQKYEYSADPNGLVVTLTKRKKGNWVPKGQPSGSYHVGNRRAYQDPCF